MSESGLLFNIGIYLAVGALVVAAWYWLCFRSNRRRAARVLEWIEEAISGYGRVSAVEWTSPSHFVMKLRMSDTCFRSPRISVRLARRESPLYWMVTRMRRADETATFEANLVCRPSFTMQVYNQRWTGRSKPDMVVNGANCITETLGPFVITSRREWQKDILQVMETLTESHACGFTKFTFNKTEPQITATVPLKMLALPDPRVNFFDLLKELGTSASTEKHLD